MDLPRSVSPQVKDVSGHASAWGRWSLPPAARVAIVVYLACLAWMPGILNRLDPLTGDEPFYVMTAISLTEDGDLNELNNYSQRDYARFYPAPGTVSDGWPGYPDPLPPHASHTERPGLYSKHGLGLAALIALPYAVGGRPLVLILLAVIAAVAAANAAALAARYAPWPVAGSVSIALALTAPLATFSLLIFPEMTAALCVAYATRRVLAARNNPWQWLLAGCCAAALPWLHYRLAPISAVIAILAIVRHRGAITPRGAIAGLTAPVVSAIGLFAWYTYLYGRPLPPPSDHAGFSGIAGTLNGLAGTFLDQQWGALVHNPLLGLAIAVAVPFAWYRRGDATALAAIILPYLLLTSSYRVWWGEWNPPARYLTAVVPLAAAPLGWWLARLRSPYVRWGTLGLFVLPGLAVMATFVADPQRMYDHPDGTSHLFETWASATPIDLRDAVPSYVFHNASPVDVRQAVALTVLGALCALATLSWLLARDASQRGRSQP